MGKTFSICPLGEQIIVIFQQTPVLNIVHKIQFAQLLNSRRMVIQLQVKIDIVTERLVRELQRQKKPTIGLHH